MWELRGHFLSHFSNFSSLHGLVELGACPLVKSSLKPQIGDEGSVL